jgi:hypothetical protein
MKFGVLFLWGALSDEMTYIRTATEAHYTRLSLRDLTGKYVVKIVMKHAQTWNCDTNYGDKFYQKSIKPSSQHQCVIMNGELVKAISVYCTTYGGPFRFSTNRFSQLQYVSSSSIEPYTYIRLG